MNTPRPETIIENEPSTKTEFVTLKKDWNDFIKQFPSTFKSEIKYIPDKILEDLDEIKESDPTSRRAFI